MSSLIRLIFSEGFRIHIRPNEVQKIVSAKDKNCVRVMVCGDFNSQRPGYIAGVGEICDNRNTNSITARRGMFLEYAILENPLKLQQRLRL